MKNKIDILFILLTLIILSFSSIKQVSALESFDDNYNLNIIASKDSNDCLTEYYLKLSDGNAIITFDLLYNNQNGYFGFIAGDYTTFGSLENMTDYFLFGKNVLSNKELQSSDNIFLSGYTYKITLNNSESKISVDKKKILDSNSEYQNVFAIDNVFTNSNAVGIACYTDEYLSETAVIDNLSITNLNGSTTYVSNDFSSTSSIKDGGMATLVTDSTTGTKISTGSIYIQNTIIFKVRFMSENGKILSEQNVSMYGTISAPTVPTKDGYEFDAWCEDLTMIKEDLIIYPIYKVKDKTVTTKKDTTNKTITTGYTSTNTGKKGGCNGNISVSSILILGLICSIFVVDKRRNYK